MRLGQVASVLIKELVISQERKAFLFLILSALTFALMTVGVKYLGAQEWPTFTVTWGRFFIGLLVISLFLRKKGKAFPRPNNPKLVFFRATTNFIAVSFFYFSIYFTTLVKANLLNMTYPLFIALLAPVFLKEATAKRAWIAVVLCLVGVFLILGLDVKDWAKGDMYGLVCGVLASLSIMSLRAARKEDDSDTILFYVMLFGTLGLSPFLENPQNPSSFSVFVFLLVSFAGVLGQAFLTFSYRYVSAISGAITGSTRILFSAILGLSFFGEPISFALVTGAICIVASVYFLQTKKASS